jgi:hypothetical protein
MLKRNALILGTQWKATRARNKTRRDKPEPEPEEEAEKGRTYDHWQKAKEEFEDEEQQNAGTPGREYMKLQEAYEIFGYSLSQKIERDELKKRFRKLTLKMHPDQGGDHEQFQKLVEAHKLLEAVRHDKNETKSSGTKKNVKSTFTRETFDNMTNTPHRETMIDMMKFDNLDVFLCALAPILVFLLYAWHEYDRGVRLIRARDRLTEEDMIQQYEGTKKEHKWHAWRVTTDEREALAFIEEKFQPRLSNAQRAAQAGILPTPPPLFNAPSPFIGCSYERQ